MGSSNLCKHSVPYQTSSILISKTKIPQGIVNLKFMGLHNIFLSVRVCVCVCVSVRLLCVHAFYGRGSRFSICVSLACELGSHGFGLGEGTKEKERESERACLSPNG